MPKMIFLNLPVSDLPRSVAFYEAVGTTKNPQFSNEAAACMVLSDTIHVMLLTHDFYRGFTSKPIADAHAASAALICVSEDSREARPTEDHGWMYSRPFEDPDGHVWEPVWMDVEAAKTAMAKESAHA